jgi:hypothetical protein
MVVAATFKSKLLSTLISSALAVVLLVPDARADSPRTKAGSGSDSATSSATKGTTAKSSSASILASNPALFEDLARFFRNLPAKSREHIWDHHLIVTRNGKKEVTLQTSNQEQITTLITDLIIVYFKAQDRTKKSLTPDVVRPLADPAAKWIMDTYLGLERQKFISDKTYFVDMLQQYQRYM